jgi:hypothetical protein
MVLLMLALLRERCKIPTKCPPFMPSFGILKTRTMQHAELRN